jgi:hypothetical protein
MMDLNSCRGGMRTPWDLASPGCSTRSCACRRTAPTQSEDPQGAVGPRAALGRSRSASTTGHRRRPDRRPGPLLAGLLKLKQAAITDAAGAWAAPAAGARTTTPDSAPTRSLRIATFMMSSLTLARNREVPPATNTRMSFGYTAKRPRGPLVRTTIPQSFIRSRARRIPTAGMSSFGS